MTKATSSPQPYAEDSGRAHFFHEAAHIFSEIRWLHLCFAFVMAVTLWYLVTVRDKVETWVDVKVEFKNTPAGLLIRDGLINKIAVRVRAAKGLSQRLAGRNGAVALDLSSLIAGSNIFPIAKDMLPFRGAYEILDIDPPRIQIRADRAKTVELPLRAVYDGSLSSDFYIQSTQLTPQSVSASGPEPVLNDLASIRVIVPLEKRMQAGMHAMRLDVDAPEKVTAVPEKVALSLTIGVRTKTVRVTREVQFDSPAGMIVKLTPAKVAIEADIPESQAKEAAVLATIAAKLAALPNDEKSGTLRVQVLLPENARLNSVSPPEVMVALTPQ